MGFRLSGIRRLDVCENIPLRDVTRFGIGGPARILARASTEDALAAVLAEMRESACPHALIGGGSNLIASDEGFSGVVLQYTGRDIRADDPLVIADAGAVLQDLVDFTIERGLKGLETMTGIPGWVGGAVYGNAGAYGHSIQERVEWVRFFDGQHFQEISNSDCDFRYRESVFKRQKDWIVVSAGLRLDPCDPAQLRATADEILKIRNEKYPPTMRCAGSIFKNLILINLPTEVREKIPKSVIREGKVPAAYFLQEVGAKGMTNGGIRVADYHANLIYNTGGGTAAQLRELIETLKLRVKNKNGLELEEEIQYL